MNLIAQTILEQLGGRKMLVMTGAKVTHGDNNLVLRLPIGKLAAFEVVYDAGSDLYTVLTFLSFKGKKLISMNTFHGVYAEDLISMFERETGLYTRL